MVFEPVHCGSTSILKVRFLGHPVHGAFGDVAGKGLKLQTHKVYFFIAELVIRRFFLQSETDHKSLFDLLIQSSFFNGSKVLSSLKEVYKISTAA